MENAQKNPQAMQEALLETLNRLARINEVEGFDPRLLVACYKNESGEENLYLPAEPAMLWFRLKYPWPAGTGCDPRDGQHGNR